MRRKTGRVQRFAVGAILAAVGLLLVSACEKLQQKYLRQDKFFRIALIEDSRLPDNSQLADELLADPEPTIRAKAALAIGRIGSELYRASLLVHLADSVPEAAEAKFFAAGLCGDSSFIDTLLGLARGAGPAREAAIEAAGRLADSGRAAQLAVFLDDADSMVVYQTLLALWRSGGWSQADRIARVGAETGNRKILYGALYALARSGRREGQALFRAHTLDADPEYRLLALAGLGRTVDTAAFELLAAGLKDPDGRVAATATTALGQLGARGTAEIGRNLYQLKDEKVLETAIETIGRAPYDGTAETIKNILRTDIRENIRAAAAEVLTKLEGSAALSLVDSILSRPTPWEKGKIALGLSGSGDRAAIPRLRQLLTDSSPEVRRSALEALVAIDTAGAAAYLSPALQDSDISVKSTAVELAAGGKLTALIPEIAGIYPDTIASINDDVKRTIIAAWDGFAGDTLRDRTYDSTIIASLRAACNDQWFVIRREAATVLWDRFRIDNRDRVGAVQSKVEKNNFRRLFRRFMENPRAVIATSRGPIVMELRYDTAPMTVNNFIALAEKGFYNRRIFHRVVPAFVVQDGCPRGDGWGGPGYTIRCEYNRLPYLTGAVGMALSGKDTGGSQYFIAVAPQPHLDGRYTVFGRVISGMETVQQMVRGDSIISVTVDYPKGE